MESRTCKKQGNFLIKLFAASIIFMIVALAPFVMHAQTDATADSDALAASDYNRFAILSNSSGLPYDGYFIRGIKYQLSPLFPNAGSVIVDKWWSSDERIISVTQTGLAKGEGRGEAYIYCSSEKYGTIFQKFEVYVTPAEGVIMRKSDVGMLWGGKTLQIDFDVTPFSGDNRLVWTSSDEGVATVDEYGVVTSDYQGVCTITATTPDGKYSASCTLRVSAFKDGVYYIESARKSYYAVDNKKMTYTSPGQISQIYFDQNLGNRQLWYIEMLDNGFYTIEPWASPFTYLYTPTNTSVAIDNNTYCDYTTDSRYQWDLTNDTIRSKSCIDANSDYCLSVSASADDTGVYIQPESYLSMWRLHAYRLDILTKEVDVYYDREYSTRYGGADAARARINSAMETAINFYKDEFGILLKIKRLPDLMTDLTDVNSCPTITDTVNGYCTCNMADDKDRHSNPYHMFKCVKNRKIPILDQRWVFTGRTNRIVKNGVIYNNPVAGFADLSFGGYSSNPNELKGILLIFDCFNQDVSYIANTLIHEVGHLFKASDHYGNTLLDVPGKTNPLQNDNCIYGVNKHKDEVYTEHKLCNSCYWEIEFYKMECLNYEDQY